MIITTTMFTHGNLFNTWSAVISEGLVEPTDSMVAMFAWNIILIYLFIHLNDWCYIILCWLKNNDLNLTIPAQNSDGLPGQLVLILGVFQPLYFLVCSWHFWRILLQNLLITVGWHKNFTRKTAYSWKQMLCTQTNVQHIAECLSQLWDVSWYV